MKLRLKQLEMKGFKPYKDVKVVCFSELTTIEGDNGQGKSSIGDAICFVLLGTGANGVENSGSKLLNNQSKDMYVCLQLEVDGEEHILTRAKKGNKSEIILDTDTVSQVELMNWIRDKDLFLSIFNPAYFTNLTPKDQKALLQKYLGEIKFDDVIKEMGSEGQQLIDDCFMVPQIYIDRKREEFKETDARENYLIGFIDGSREEEVPKEKVFEKQDKVHKIMQSIAELDSKPSFIHDIADKIKVNKTLQSKLNEMSDKVRDINIKKIEFEEEKLLAENEREREKLLVEHNAIKRQIESIQKATCPKCGEVFDVNMKLKTDLEKQLKDIVANGKMTAEKIEKLKVIIEQKKNEHKKNNERIIAETEKAVIDIKVELDSVDISALQAENDEYSRKMQAEKDELKNQLEVLKVEKQSIEMFNSNRLSIIAKNKKNEAAIEDAKAEIETFEPLKVKLNQDIELAKKFNSTKLRMQGEFIGKFLDKVNIQFQKVVKSTGEIKDDFKLQYEGKDFNLLSTSERIKAGLEISNLLMNATGYIYPVFVDNAESVTQVPQLDTQMVVAKVKEGAVLR